MILFKKEDLTGHEAKFKTTKAHPNTWANYTAQYEYLLRHLNQTALKTNYQLNIKSYPYLFLLRHFCELKFKTILNDRQIDFGRKHELPLLIDMLGDVPEHLNKAIAHIDLDRDGSCYRYFFDKYGNLTPVCKMEKKVLPFYQEQTGIPADSIYNWTLGIVPPYKKMLPWEFTFHFNEIGNQAQLRSTYDEVTDYVLKGVISDDIDINEVYLPLLFLLRHSVELVLKDSLKELIHTQDEQTIKKVKRLIDNEHKLSPLFKAFLAILPDDVSGLPEEMQEQYHNFLVQSDRMKSALHTLDNNSRYFRFPYDIDQEHPMGLPAEALYHIISDFLETDGFLTFCTSVLKDYNIIRYSDDEIAMMMGYDPLL